MNIFILDSDPSVAARMLHDKHVVKMILETAQILGTVADRHGIDGDFYKPTHQHHPCTLWAGDSYSNAQWLIRHGLAMSEEYSFRFAKSHASEEKIRTAHRSFLSGKFPWFTMTDPAQAMPEQYRVPGNAIQAYRSYYLGEKLHQSRWTRRPVPELFKESYDMTKKDKMIGAAVPASADVPAAAPAPTLINKIGVRGLKGVPITAAITLHAAVNPKRPGSSAQKKFSLYVTGMTQGQFLEAGGTTPDLAYDTAHGFISVEGYAPPKVFQLKERAPKAEKTPKTPRADKPKKEKVVPTPSEDAEALAAATVEETIE